MTTSITTLIAAPNRTLLNTSYAVATLQPGQTLTDSQLRQALPGIVVQPQVAAQPTAMPPVQNVDNANNAIATTGDTITTNPGQPVAYNSGISDWIMNNPGLAIGAGLVLAYGIYQLTKKRR